MTIRGQMENPFAMKMFTFNKMELLFILDFGVKYRKKFLKQMKANNNHITECNHNLQMNHAECLR